MRNWLLREKQVVPESASCFLRALLPTNSPIDLFSASIFPSPKFMENVS
jgi:hypothetical protein